MFSRKCCDGIGPACVTLPPIGYLGAIGSSNESANYANQRGKDLLGPYQRGPCDHALLWDCETWLAWRTVYAMSPSLPLVLA